MTMLLYHFISQDLEGNICAKYTEDLKKKKKEQKQNPQKQTNNNNKTKKPN